MGAPRTKTLGGLLAKLTSGVYFCENRSAATARRSTTTARTRVTGTRSVHPRSLPGTALHCCRGTCPERALLGGGRGPRRKNDANNKKDAENGEHARCATDHTTDAFFLCSSTGIASRRFRLAGWEAADVDWGGRFGAEVVIMTWDHEIAFPRGLFDLVGASPSDARAHAANKPKVRIRWW